MWIRAKLVGFLEGIVRFQAVFEPTVQNKRMYACVPCAGEHRCHKCFIGSPVASGSRFSGGVCALPSARHAVKSGAIMPGASLIGKNTSNQTQGAVKHGMQIHTIQAVIADDDNVTRHLLRTLLRQHAIEVIGEACNGKEALQKCAALTPDLLFLDINMQEMGGFETLHALRQDMPGLAVIMISSDSTADNVRKALAQGAAGFVVKPFCPASVIEAVTRCTHKHA